MHESQSGSYGDLTPTLRADVPEAAIQGKLELTRGTEGGNLSCVGVRDPVGEQRWLRGRVWKQDNSQSGGFRDPQGGVAGEERLSQRAERGS